MYKQLIKQIYEVFITGTSMDTYTQDMTAVMVGRTYSRRRRARDVRRDQERAEHTISGC
jgi:hypothetical protein